MCQVNQLSQNEKSQKELSQKENKKAEQNSRPPSKKLSSPPHPQNTYNHKIRSSNDTM